MDEVIEKLRRFDSATVANAIEHFEVRDPTTGYADNRLVCQTPGIAAPMVGRAFTCKVDTATPGDTRPARVDELVQLLPEAETPFVLVARHEGADQRRGCVFGDMFCAVLVRLGGAGWVVSHGYPAYLEFNTPVEICGLEIAPGDLLHGDGSGLVSVPLEIAADVAARAEEVRGQEEEFFRFLQGDGFSMEELKHRFDPRTED
ncbi:MAG: hypothetical protein OXH50_04785 [Gemmatimonadetes bacterium]|nr:hypothetical protein [Gemmatimonadota bacterium]